VIAQTKNNKTILMQRLVPADFDKLTDYLHHLSPETVRRFGPHGFDKEAIRYLFENTNTHNGYIALESETSEIIAYSILKIGYLEHDSFRLQSYGLTLNMETDCTFAPSVADAWQSLGVGNSMYQFVVSEMKSLEVKRIILWGGVQADNDKAVNYYLQNGFRILGEFEYHGRNFDMISEIV
jgi:ribosomal protein S18 acetylase RimI-like enzyme